MSAVQEPLYYKDVDISKINVKPNEKAKSTLGKEFTVYYQEDNGVKRAFKFFADEQQILWGIQLEYMPDDNPKADKDRARVFQFGCADFPITKTADGKYVCSHPDAAPTLEFFEFIDKVNARILECVKTYVPKAFYEVNTVRSLHEKDADKPENYSFHGKLAGTGADVKPGEPRKEFDCWSRFRNPRNELMSLEKFTRVSKRAFAIPAMDCTTAFCATKKNSALSTRYRADQFTLTIKGTNPDEKSIPNPDISRAKRARVAPVYEDDDDDFNEKHQVTTEEEPGEVHEAENSLIEENEPKQQQDDPLMF